MLNGCHGSLKPLSRYLPTKTLESIYKSFIRPHLDYCDVAYHEPLKINALGQFLSIIMEEIERIQYQWALSIARTWKGTKRLKLYEELGWKSLSDRRRVRRVLLFHKIVNNSTPEYLKDKITAQRPDHVGISPPLFKCLVLNKSFSKFIFPRCN